MMRILIRGGLLLSLTILTAAPGLALTVELPAGQDNSLFQLFFGEASNGAGEYLFAGHLPSGLLRRGLIEFDVAGVIAPGATITDVTLVLHMSKTTAAVEPISLHRVTSDWGEGTADAPDEEGAGTTPAGGDATWENAFYPGTPWTAAGGDFDPAASASADVGGVGTYSWTGAGLVADVQAWLDDPSSNHGWMLVGNEAGDRTAKRFDSRENGTPANRPLLVIEFSGEVPTLLTTWGGVKSMYSR